jgi:methyl coenzyme M reductase gamma subunit
MTSNPQLLYAILAMDAYHRGDDGGIIVDYMNSRPTEIDDTVRGIPNPDNPYGFSAQSYTRNGTTIIAYRGTDDGSGRSRAGG